MANSKGTEEKIEVMIAYRKGADIQLRDYYGGGAWEECLLPSWNWYSFEYRVKLPAKKEPTVLWANLYSDGGGIVCSTEERAKEIICRARGYIRTVKLAEVE